MKVEILGTQKDAIPLSFSNFDFLLIYKADSAGLRTYPFEIEGVWQAQDILLWIHIYIYTV